MPQLPAQPNLEYLKKQAKTLLQALRDGDAGAAARFGSLGKDPRLADAQHVIAREHGFSSWTALKEHIESLAEPAPREALIAAVKAQDVRRARELLQRHGDLRAKINDPAPEIPFGGRPIGAVAGTKNLKLLDLFIEFGADINARSDWAPGSWGVLDGADPDFAPHLIARGARVDAHAAAHLGMLDTLQQLVRADPSVVHTRGGDGQTPLHFASSIAIADFLLDHGADIDALDVDHEGTPAQWMIRERTEIARHLVRRGARTDILMAVALGDLDLVRRYLDQDPTAVRTTALPEYFPVRGPLAAGHIYLWSLGRNKTAHEIAKDFRHDEVWQLLMQRSPADVQLVEAARLGDETLIQNLLQSLPDLTHALPAHAKRKLVDAAQDERPDAVRRLLQAGWPTDGRGQEDGTALHWASFLGNAAIVRELLRYGAAVEARESTYGGTPLTWASYGSVHSWTRTTGDYAGTVLLLLDAGAEVPDDLEGSDAVRQVLERRKKLA